MEEFKVRDLKKQEHIASYVNDLKGYTPPKRKILLIDAVYGMTSRYFSFNTPRIGELHYSTQEGLVVKFDMYYEGFQVLFSVGPSQDGAVKNAKFKNFMDVRKKIDPEELRNTINMLRLDMQMINFATNGYRTWAEFTLPDDKRSVRGFSYDYLELIFNYEKGYEEEYDWLKDFLLSTFSNDLNSIYKAMQEDRFAKLSDEQVKTILASMQPDKLRKFLQKTDSQDGIALLMESGIKLTRKTSNN